MNITDLSPYIVKQILYYVVKPHQLANVGIACRRWHSLVYELFMDVNLSVYGQFASQRTIRKLIERSCNYLRVLDLTGCKQVDDETLLYISLCSQLHKLVLSWVDMKTTEDGLQFLHRCTSLSTLSISNPEWSFPDVAFPRTLNAKGFEYISQCTALTELSVCGPPCSRLTLQSFLYLLYCTNLKSLQIDTRKANCNFLISDEMFENIQYLQKLESLSLSGLAKDITEEGLRNLGKLPNLTSLSLQYQWGLVNLGFLELCSRLQVLKLDFQLLKSEEFEQFNAFCSPTLTALELTRATYLLNRHIPQLGMFMLSSLTIHFAVNITDDGLRYIGEYCHNLKNLELSGCHNIMGEGFFHLAVCTQLTALSLHKCKNITDEAFKWLPFILQLQVLKVEGLNKVSDLTLDFLLDCLSLRELHLKACPAITAKSVVMLSQNSVSLQQIFVSECKSITNLKDVKGAYFSPHGPARRHGFIRSPVLPVRSTITLDSKKLVAPVENIQE